MTFRSLITLLVVPPINLLFLAIAGLVLLRWRRVGLKILWFGLAGLLVSALPVTSDVLMTMLQDLRVPAPDVPPAAIVILSGDIQHVDGDTPHADVGPLTLARLRRGAALYRETHLPVLITGGVIDHTNAPVAELMAKSLNEDFAVPTRWTEITSQTTWENAKNSAAILKSAGVRSVFLVTHAWHMRRALIAFARFGIEATPASIAPEAAPRFRPEELLPSATAWLRSYYAFHEWIGCLWYELRAHWGGD